MIQPKTLFAVHLGGVAESCNTELHDTVFVVAESLEKAYPQLVHKWFGIPTGLHIDASVALQHVDGYEVVLSDEPNHNTPENHLFFINFGGYQSGVFGEQHQVGFYVAKDKQEAKARGKKELLIGSHLQHCDNKVVVDDIKMLDRVGDYYIHLRPSKNQLPLTIIADYKPLDVPVIMEKAEQLVAIKEYL